MPTIIPLDPADFQTFLRPLLHRLPLDTILPVVLLLLLLYVGTKFCSFSTSSYTMAWWREKCRYSATALYSKEGQKSFFPETHGPEIVMEEQPEKHFFWLTLGLHTTGIATVECTASCILS